MTYVCKELALKPACLLGGCFICNKSSFLLLLCFNIPLSGFQLSNIHYKSNHALNRVFH